MPTIAMSREIGSEGQAVAHGVAEQLSLALHPSGTEHELPYRRGSNGSGSQAGRPNGRRWRRWPDRYGLTRGNLSAEDVLALALRGGVLIRGWGAAQLLRDIPHVLTVRISAPTEQRVEAICAQSGVRAAVARRLIKKWDAAHERSLRGSFVGYSQRPHSYDLMLDAGTLSVDRCIRIICDAAANAKLGETPQSRAMLEERMAEARLCSAVHALRNVADVATPRRGRALSALFGPRRLMHALSDGRKTVAKAARPDEPTVNGSASAVP